MTRTESEVGELYMILRDRKKLASILIVQDISQRELARAAGWKSHSYMGRLLRGEAKTVDAEAAVRISHRLGLPLEHLFLTVVSEKTGSPVQSERTKRGAKKSRPAA
ncbi:helix-turn-helix transcriptional regulator [Gordonia sp. NB41Y]|uniref:helix-turn-helix domain-containing protein n=1 Tax=Gordonia sp. NB41Y TaxID=875808 RepID=UPI0021C98563|nr:helix-turn-helix transcriptional regulator [Gordonia sp. NB41Y]WLP90221.1 helix-turn-helix transcriptional regulator [Gordonia sp. NB41Y]